MGIHEQDTAVSMDDAEPVRSRTGAYDCLALIYRRNGLPLVKRTNLDRPVIRIGRGTDNDIVLEDEEVSRRHARVEARGGVWVLMDVGSTNGTFINGRELEGYVKLERGDLVKLGSHIFKFLAGSDVESAFHDEIYRLTITDNLTGLPNRRALGDELARELSRARRHDLPTSFLMIDIDHFKHINDTFGHQAGDAVLVNVAAAVRSQTRNQDTVARFGGEEIAVLMPQTTIADAVSVAERIRAAVEALVSRYRGNEIRVTVSLGCAALSEADIHFEDLVRRADDKLYEAKHAGKNRVAS